MKILFIQLPLIDHGYNYIGGNVQYASALLTAYIRKNYKDIYVEYLPYNLTNFGSDGLILKYIEKIKYDIICFSNYLWNAERNLELANLIKINSPKSKIIFGGPEICENSFIFENQNQNIDLFFNGEGEWFFKKYFSNNFTQYLKIINQNKLVIQPPNELISENEMIEPYSANFLNLMPDKSIFMEIIRGCPFKCIYCYYSKNANKIREASSEILFDAIMENDDIQEIYLLAPTFNKSKNFEKILDKLVLINKNIKLHTEIKAEGITEKIAEKIYKSGFQSLEIGIQTLNEIALKKSNRSADIKKEIEGLKNLKNAGIDLKIGIIPGLPDDTPESFYKTIDVLIENGFEEQIELYPLMVLPGTLVRERSDYYNMKFLNKPPYFIIENNNFKFNDIINVKNYLEEKTGIYSSFNLKPDFFNNNESILIKGIEIDAEKVDPIDEQKILDFIHTNVFSFHIKNYDKQVSLESLFSFLTERKELFNIILYSSKIIDDIQIKNLMKKYENNDFYRRLHLYDEWKYGNKIFIYQIIEDLDVFIEAEFNYIYTEPILKLNFSNYNNYISNINLFEEVPSVLIDSTIYKITKDFLVEYYREYFDKISFLDEKDYQDFCKLSENEYIELPINFRLFQI